MQYLFMRDAVHEKVKSGNTLVINAPNNGCGMEYAAYGLHLRSPARPLGAERLMFATILAKTSANPADAQLSSNRIPIKIP